MKCKNCWDDLNQTNRIYSKKWNVLVFSFALNFSFYLFFCFCTLTHENFQLEISFTHFFCRYLDTVNCSLILLFSNLFIYLDCLYFLNSQHSSLLKFASISWVLRWNEWRKKTLFCCCNVEHSVLAIAVAAKLKCRRVAYNTQNNTCKERMCSVGNVSMCRDWMYGCVYVSSHTHSSVFVYVCSGIHSNAYILCLYILTELTECRIVPIMKIIMDTRTHTYTSPSSS